MRWWRCGAISALVLAVVGCAAPSDVTVQGSGRLPAAGEAVAAAQPVTTDRATHHTRHRVVHDVALGPDIDRADARS